ncbi:MAG TPA: SRPBCC family protein, partial [Acidimicrobiales bacterium]|nr:SRPBCC family protein [Acidimicrobiales bacterium]
LEDDPATSQMDVWILEPTPAGDTPPPATAVRHLGFDQSWKEAPELGYMGPILDQDTATLERVQRGLASSAKPGVTLSRYQESRIRHFHATLGSYLDA